MSLCCNLQCFHVYLCRASSEGQVERCHKDLSSGEEVVQVMNGKSKEEIHEFYNVLPRHLSLCLHLGAFH